MIEYRVEEFERLTSTMDVVRDRLNNAENIEAEGLVIQTMQQISGRGRHGNEWASPKGNLYISILLRPGKPLKDFGQMAFIVALAMRDALMGLGVLNEDIRFKWPNDLLLNGRKAAGLLLEAGQDIHDQDYIVLGAGINVLSAPEGKAQLDEFVPMVSVQAARDAFLLSLSHHYKRWHVEEFAVLKDEWLKYAAFIGKKIKVRTAKSITEGVFQTIDADGALLLRLNSGITQRVQSGEVFAQ